MIILKQDEYLVILALRADRSQTLSPIFVQSLLTVDYTFAYEGAINILSAYI